MENDSTPNDGGYNGHDGDNDYNMNSIIAFTHNNASFKNSKSTAMQDAIEAAHVHKEHAPLTRTQQRQFQVVLLAAVEALEEMQHLQRYL